MQNTYWEVFFHCSKPFFNSLILITFSVSAIFVSPLPHWQNVSLWRLSFIWGNTKRSLGVRSGELGGWGTGAMPFLVKNCWTLSVVWAGALVNHPSWNGQTCWKSLQKISLKLNAASHNNASWYADTDGFLEHSSSGGNLYYKGLTLQKIIPDSLGSPPPYIKNSYNLIAQNPQTIWLKNRQKIWIDIFPKKIYKRPTVHEKTLNIFIREMQIKPQWNIVSYL